MDEERKQILDKILADFNAIGTKAMMELSNGSGSFTIKRGAWTVSLDVEGYMEHLNECCDRMEKIVDEASRKWREHLEQIRKTKETHNEN